MRGFDAWRRKEIVAEPECLENLRRNDAWFGAVAVGDRIERVSHFPVARAVDEFYRRDPNKVMVDRKRDLGGEDILDDLKRLGATDEPGVPALRPQFRRVGEDDAFLRCISIMFGVPYLSIPLAPYRDRTNEEDQHQEQPERLLTHHPLHFHSKTPFL